jgi:hypothetical protein
MNCKNGLQVDHVNGDKLDNRKDNLRICNGTQNQGNMKIPKHNTSGIKGVSWHKATKKWVANIRINKKPKYLGSFSSKLDAKEIYTKFAKQYFGEFYSDGIRKSVI